MITIVLESWQAVFIALAIPLSQFILGIWIKASIENSIRSKHELELRAKQQAEKVAEYMALARSLKPDSSDADYQKANQMAWELAIWLPSQIYQSMSAALTAGDGVNNPLSVAISVRKELLGSAAGTLTQSDVLHHAPNIGDKRRT